MGFAHCAIVWALAVAYTVHQLAQSPPFPDLDLEQFTRGRGVLLWRVIAAAVCTGTTYVRWSITKEKAAIFRCKKSGSQVTLYGKRAFTTVRSEAGSCVTWHSFMRRLLHTHRLSHAIRSSMHFFHVATQFTCIIWAAQNVYFLLALAASLFAAVAPAAVAAAFSASPLGAALLQLAWALHDLSLTTSLLGTTIVTFVLYPLAYKNDMMHLLSNGPAIVMHHWNSVNTVGELYLNAVPVLAAHIHITILFGLSYVVFAYFWFRHTGVYYYVFLDYRRAWAPIAYVMILAVLHHFHSLTMRFSAFMGK
jgi:hypothetical protein